MKRITVVRVQGLDEPEFSFSQLEGITQAEAKALEDADQDQWGEYLEGVDVKSGEVALIGYNNGDVDMIVAPIGGWVTAVEELREWFGQFPRWDCYEIYWKFSRGNVRRYSKDY